MLCIHILFTASQCHLFAPSLRLLSSNLIDSWSYKHDIFSPILNLWKFTHEHFLNISILHCILIISSCVQTITIFFLLFSCTSVGLFFLSLSLSVQSIFLSFLKGTSVQLSNSPIHFIYFDQLSNLFIPFLKKHHCLLLFSTLHYSQTILFLISSSPVCGIIQDCICEVTFFFPKKIKKHVLTNGSTPYKPHLIIFSIISGYNKPIFVVSFSLSWCNKRIREWKQILCTCCILVLHQNL